MENSTISALSSKRVIQLAVKYPPATVQFSIPDSSRKLCSAVVSRKITGSPVPFEFDEYLVQYRSDHFHRGKISKFSSTTLLIPGNLFCFSDYIVKDYTSFRLNFNYLLPTYKKLGKYVRQPTLFTGFSDNLLLKFSL